MSYLHSHDIIHRDLKPDNILLDDYLFPKVADFGLSKATWINHRNSSISSSSNKIMGTPIYLSPEIWSNSSYSKSGDVYAFGIILYELMTLERPFQKVDFFNIQFNVLQGIRPEFNTAIPNVYKSLIERCWSQEPEKRPTFDEILFELRTNHAYIIDTVNEEVYKNYIKYIDESIVTFDSSKVIIPTNSIRSRRNEDNLIQTLNSLTSKSSHFPFKYFNELSSESQLLVKEASESNDSKKQYEVGRNFIEGRYDFPFDLKIGLDFLKDSIENGNKYSLIYYIRMLIKGTVIPSNHKKACKLIQKFSNDKATRMFLCGKLFKNEKQYVEAANFFKKSIELGESAYEYAELLRKGYIPCKDRSDITKYYQEAINKGCLKAIFKFGVILTKNTQKNYQQKGFELIRYAIRRGYIKAIHYQGLNIEKENYKSSNYFDIIVNNDSVKYFQIAAKNGHFESMFLYGFKMAELYKCTSKDKYKREAIRYLKKGCDKGMIESIYELGNFLETIDINESIKYLKLAADNGHIKAMFHYSSMLELGLVIKPDYDEAIRYIKMAADKGDSIAQSYYRDMLINGVGNETRYSENTKYNQIQNEEHVQMAASKTYSYRMSQILKIPKSAQLSIHSLRLAVKKGDPVAMNDYALCLQDGKCLKVNYQEAHKYFKMAIDKGETSAMVNYAQILKNGIGVNVNYKEAAKYFKMAADHDEPEGMYGYAVMLDEGKGVKLDYKEAAKYYKRAADRGQLYSMYCYALMLANGQGVEVNYKEAIKYLKIGIEKGDPLCMVKLGKMLQYGQGVEVNIKEAKKYYKMASNLGNTEAMILYLRLNEDQSNNDSRKVEEMVDEWKNALENGKIEDCHIC